jgi:hypothetical protein
MRALNDNTAAKGLRGQWHIAGDSAAAAVCPRIEALP